MKLGICISLQGGWLKGLNEPVSFDSVRKIALFAEAAGFDSLWLPDHLLNPIHGEQAPCLEGWTVAAALAPLTKSIKLAHTTLSAAFRYPAVLAKQATTLQEISGGRFWLSLGAGFFEPEFRAYGLPWAEHDRRIARASEALQIIKALFAEETAEFRGEYYQIKEGILEPKPRPRPLIWYGGNSGPSRELALDHADGWLTSGEGLAEVRATLQEMNEQVARRERRRLLYGLLTGLVIVRESDAQAQAAARRLLGKLGLERALRTGLVGSPGTVAGQIEQYAQSGVDQLILRFSPGLAELERFVERVGPLKFP